MSDNRYCKHEDMLINAVAHFEKGVSKYLKVKGLFDSGNEEEFRKEFCSFYGVNGSRRGIEWKEKFFDIMMEYKGNKEVNFDEVLERVKRELGSYEGSFISKYLNLIDDCVVIWDSNVLRFINEKVKYYNNSYDERVKLWERIRVYNSIRKWYEDFLGSEESKKWIRVFDELIGVDMSDVRKIDFYLWFFGSKNMKV